MNNGGSRDGADLLLGLQLCFLNFNEHRNLLGILENAGSGLVGLGGACDASLQPSLGIITRVWKARREPSEQEELTMIVMEGRKGDKGMVSFHRRS